MGYYLASYLRHSPPALPSKVLSDDQVAWQAGFAGN